MQAQGMGDGDQSLGRDLLAAALYLGEVGGREPGLGRDLAQSSARRLAAGPQDGSERAADLLGGFAVGESHLSWANDTTKSRSAARESRPRRLGQAGLAAASTQLELQAFQPAGHGPAVVGGEDGTQDGRAVAEERLLSRDPPVVGGLDEVAVLPDLPHAVPSKSPCATSLNPEGRVDSVTVKFQRRV